MNILKQFATDMVRGVAKEAKETFKFRKGTNTQTEEEHSRKQTRMVKFKGASFSTVPGLLGRKKVQFRASDYRHKMVFGSTGSGKTELAKNIVISKTKRGEGICYIDNADGESIRDIINTLPTQQLNEIILLDHSDKYNPLPVGYMESTGDVFQDDIIVNQWVSFFISNFGIEDQFMTQELLVNACKAVFATKGSTVLDIVYFIQNYSFRSHLLAHLDSRQHKDVINYWKYFASQSDGQKQQITASLLRRTGMLFRDKFLKYTLGQVPKNPLNYRKWIDEGKTVLINVPESLGKQAVKIVVSLHILGFWRAALSRDNISQEYRKPFNIIADEPQSWLGNNADLVDDIFSKARKYHLGLTCMFQSVKQVQKESKVLLDIMLDNEPDIIVFQTTKSQLNTLGIDQYNKQLPKWNFYFKSREEQFTAKALKPIIPSYNNYQRVDEKSKKTYNKRYQQVEKEIEGRILKWQNMEGRKSRSHKSGSKIPVSQESPKGIKKSSGSSMRIDW